MTSHRNPLRWIALALVPIAILTTNELASGAVSAALQIPGIDGEGPGDSIVLLSYGFTAPDGSSLAVTKALDSTSPQLTQLVVTGQHIPVMTLTADVPSAGTVVFAFFDVLITSLVSNGGAVPTETLTFAYASHTQARPSGSAAYSVRVSDLCTEKPIEGATVELTPVEPNTPGFSGGTSNRSGLFKFTGIATGDYQLVVSASGHLSLTKVVAVVGARGQSESVALVPLTSAGCQ